MTQLHCPVCGADDLFTEGEARTYTPPFGPTRAFTIELQTCRVCGESGDFARSTSAVTKQAVEEADRASIEPMLGALARFGTSTAALERVLRLPARTVARWKSGKVSASGLALMRLVRRFPWLLEVAEAGYSEAAADRAVLQAAGEVLAKRSTIAASRGVSTVAAPGEQVPYFGGGETSAAAFAHVVGAPLRAVRDDDTELQYAA